MAAANTMDRAGLVAQILAQAPNQDVAMAMLFGSTGESNQSPTSSGSGGGGAFGFTPPSYPAWLETASPEQQVAAILPSYVAAAQQIPGTVSNPAARAEWIAIAAERPLGFTGFHSGELGTIEANNAPTEYGANSSLNGQATYQQILQEYQQGNGGVPSSGGTPPSPQSQTGVVAPNTASIPATGTLAPTTAQGANTPSTQYIGGGTSQTGVPNVTPTVPGMNDIPALVKYIKQNWPTYSWLLDVPSVTSVLEKAVATGFSDQQIQAAVSQTQWWKTTANSVQQFQQLKNTSPAELTFKPGTQASQMYAQVQAAANQAGLKLDAGQLQHMALNAMEYGWTSDQLTRNVGSLAATGQGSTVSPTYLQQMTQNPKQLQFSKPGVVKTVADQQLANVQAAARAAGINLPTGKAQELAVQAMEYGWSDTYLQQNIGSLAGGIQKVMNPQYLQMQAQSPGELKFTTAGNTQADQALQTVRTAANQAGLKLSDGALHNLASEYLEYGWSNDELTTRIGQASTQGQTLSPTYLQNMRANPQLYKFTTAGNTLADQALNTIRTAAAGVGLKLPDSKLQAMAMQSLEYGWTSSQIATAIGQQAHGGQAFDQKYLTGLINNPKQYQFTTGKAGGKTVADQALNDVRAAAAQAGLQLSPARLQSIAQQALEYGWDQNQTSQYIAQVSGQGGAKSFSSTYTQLQQTNPQQLKFTTGGKTQADQQLAQVKAAADTAGLKLPEGRMKDLAMQALQYGWTPDEVTQNVGGLAAQGKGQTLSSQYLQGMTANPQEYQFTPGGNTQADQALANVRNTAAQAGLRLGDSQMQSLAMESLRNGWTSQQLQQQVAGEANKGQSFSSTYTQGLLTNPAEYRFTPGGGNKTQADQMLTEVEMIGSQNGVNLKLAEAQELANQALKFGWNNQDIQRSLGQFVSVRAGQPATPNQMQTTGVGQQAPGQGPNVTPAVQTNAGAVVQQLRTAAASYLESPTDPALQQWAKNIADGSQTMDQYNAYLAQQAALKYPGMAEQIRNGLNPTQITSNLQQLAANTLEISPNQVDFVNDPTFSKMLDGGYSLTGQGTKVPNQQMMTYSQAGDYLRNLPQYQTTTGARSQAADLETSILQAFGRVA
jgi:hypothetical protein